MRAHVHALGHPKGKRDGSTTHHMNVGKAHRVALLLVRLLGLSLRLAFEETLLQH